LQSTREVGALIVAFAVVGLALAAPPVAPAQFGGPTVVAQNIKIKSPVASQVFQREVNGRAVIPIALDESAKDATVVDAAVVAENQDPNTNKQLADRVTFFECKLVGVPVGGPYKVNLAIKKNNQLMSKEVGPVFVGDLWVVAGQSNMEGVGDLIDVTPPHPMVMNLGMNGKWARAEEPLHWLVDSPDPVHSGNPNDRAGRSAQQHRTRAKGAGLGLPFAVALVEQTRVPIGLVACAHGGTSMEQWNPAKKNEGGNSLYGSFLRQIQLAGGKVKGVLWYQGESDAMGGDAWKIYHRVFADFIASVRADLNQTDLPFYYVQIGRFVNAADPKGWNAVQEVQRRLPERVPNTGGSRSSISSAFTNPNWAEFEKAIAGGWRNQGFHRPPHEYTVKKTVAKHPISYGLPVQFEHTIDELYQNSVMVTGNIVLATAYSDPKKPRGTGKDEPVIWVNTYGKGRVYVNILGHDVKAMSDPNFHAWLRRGVIWAATGNGEPQASLEPKVRLLPRSEYLDK